MRIVLLEFSPSGGLFQFAYQLGEALANQSATVQLLTGPEPELTSHLSNFEVRPALSTWHPQRPEDTTPRLLRKVRRLHRAGLLVIAWGQVLRHLRRERPDVVLFSTWRFPLDAWGVVAIRKLLPHATLAIVAHEPRPLVEQDVSHRV